MIQQGFKIKLKVNKRIELIFKKHCGCSRFIYNYLLGKNIEAYDDRCKFLNLSQMSKILTNLKKDPEYSWLKEVESQSLQQSIRHLIQAFENMKKNRKHFGFPRFKKKKRSRESFTISNNADNSGISNNRLILQTIGRITIVRYKKALKRLPKDYKLTSVVIFQDSDQNWYASLKIENNDNQIIPEIKDELIGIDLGILNNYTMSYSNNGQFEHDVKENVKSYSKLEKRLAFLQQELSRKVKGSNRYNKCRKLIAKIHFKIKSIRKNFNHQLSILIIKDFRIIVIEDLDLKEMLSKKSLAKRIIDPAFYQFRLFLEYKCRLYNRILIIVDRFFPSSKTCSNCGNVKSDLKISDRTYTCEVCHSIKDRDINASDNLYNIGWYKMMHSKVLKKEEYSSWRQEEYLKAA